MYEKDGIYGKVRFGYKPIHSELRGVLDYISHCGWHQCNEMYMIMRKVGRPDEYLLLFTVEGVGEYLVKGERYLLRANSVAIVPMNIGHSYYTQPGENNQWEFYWMHIRGANCIRIIGNIVERFGYSFLLDEFEAVLSCVTAIVDAKCVGVEYEIMSARMISEMLMTILSSKLCAKKNSDSGYKCSDKVIKYVENRLDQTISIDEIARTMYLSKEHVIRMFKRETGQTPYQYIKARRIAKAKELLRFTNMPLKCVASSVGYTSVNAFGTQFHATTGLTPLTYRLKTMRT